MSLNNGTIRRFHSLICNHANRFVSLLVSLCSIVQNLSLDGGNILPLIWSPRACFVNSKMASIHRSPFTNIFLMIYSNGTVFDDNDTKTNCFLRCGSTIVSNSPDRVKRIWNHFRSIFKVVCSFTNHFRTTITTCIWNGSHRGRPFHCWKRLCCPTIRWQISVPQAYDE